MAVWPVSLAGISWGGGWPLLHAGVAHGSPWDWHAHPDVWLAMLALEGAYLGALRFLGPRRAGGGRPATRGQVALFTLGVLSLWAATDWPMDNLADSYLYSAHMVQHMLLTLVAPPLLLLGTPGWLVRWLIRPRWAMAVMRRLTRPVVALLVFNGVLVVSHLPVVVDVYLRHDAAHFSMHAALVGSGVLMWWPVLSPVEELRRLAYPWQMAYLFLQSVVPTVPASFLTFAGHPLYEFYETAPRLWGISAATDQQVAGLIMKLAGGLFLWSVIAVLFYRWYQEESREEPARPTWDEVQGELERMGLTRR